MERTWMPTVAGILGIVAGVFSILVGLDLILYLDIARRIVAAILTLGQYLGSISIGFVVAPLMVFLFMFLLAGMHFGLVAAPIIVGILALAGGLYALRRGKWGLALAGSIVALLVSPLFGIPAIIFTALSKNEFA